jgi:tRNA nucleotidyltransferase/poly(A) polymerase
VELEIFMCFSAAKLPKNTQKFFASPPPVNGSGGEQLQTTLFFMNTDFSHLVKTLYKTTPPLANIAGLLRRQGCDAYLVGGAVRDALLGRANLADLDFVTLNDGLETARQVANELGGAFYPLDSARGTGRVILPALTLDFATCRGPTLTADLQDRDFTINAMALSLADPPHLIDPFHGQADLQAGVIRPVTPASFLNDPMRVLRAIRQAVQFDFTLTPTSERLLPQAAPGLAAVSPERQRDELLKLLNTPTPGQGVQLLRRLEVLPHLLPEVAAMAGVKQGPPHHLDVFDHTAAALNAWARLAATGLPALWPEEWPHLELYLDTPLAGGLSVRQLMPLALLWHDTGKPLTRTVDAGRVRFLGHEIESARLASQIMQRLRFSNQAVDFVGKVITHHMRPLLLAQAGSAGRRAVYRFFRATAAPVASAGPATTLHTLADHQATYHPGSGGPEWEALLKLAHQLVHTFFHEYDQMVAPAPLLSGRDLIRLGVSQGPMIGRLLDRLKESQATGQVSTYAEAVAYVQADPDFSPMVE